VKITLTGSTGFVGLNLQKYLKTSHQVEAITVRYSLNQKIELDTEALIHLAGKVHDTKNLADSDKYYEVNTELTKTVFDAFLLSKAEVFIMLSSVKAVADEVEGDLTEDHLPNPLTHYGRSKLLAEEYILSKEISKHKRVYILRPCMIHGPGNKGNLNLLYRFVSKGIPWPLGAFENKRSFCSIDNLLFIVKELIERADIPSGVYNVADDEAVSTNDVISIIAESKDKNAMIWKVSKSVVQFFAKFGDYIKLPLNEERLHKLTGSYVVSNRKIVLAIGKPLSVSSKEGLLKTFKSFK
jgi:nucleoside-diphosphate-sugar epimerase